MNNQMHEDIPYSPERSTNFHEDENTGFYFPPHWHRGLEFIYVEEGSLDVTINDTMITLHEDNFAVISPKDVHATHCLHHCKNLVMQISYNFLKQYVPGVDALHFGNINLPHTATDPRLNRETAQPGQEIALYDSAIGRLLRHMFQIYQNPFAYSDLIFHKLLFELIYHIVHNYSSPINPILSVKNAKELDRLMPVLNFIQDNYNRPLTLRKVASFACLNPQYFCRYFKRYVGIDLTEYIDSIRLQHVTRELTSTDIPIYTLLEKHGFKSSQHFRALFRQTFHETPSAFRQKLLK